MEATVVGSPHAPCTGNFARVAAALVHLHLATQANESSGGESSSTELLFLACKTA